MIVRAAPSGRHAPQAPTRLANNFRPALSRLPAAQLPRDNFVEEPRLPAEEETSVRISIPQPKAVYSESQPYLKAPVLTALRGMRSFSEEELKETQHRRPPPDQLADEEPETSAQPRRDDGEGRTRNRPSGQPRTPTPAPQQIQRRPKLTLPEVEAPKVLQRVARAPSVSRQAEATHIAITPDKQPLDRPERVEAETHVAITPEKKAEPARRLAPAPAPERPAPERSEPIQAPPLSLQAVPLAYAEPETKTSLFARLRGWFSDGFVPWLTELKESAILRLLALVVLLIVASKGLLVLVQMFGE
jgi:hypothetical protein